MFSLNTLKSIYLNSPVWLKIMYSKIPYSIRNGLEYQKWRNFLLKDIDIEEYKLMKLKETISYASKYSKYYIDLFIKIGFEPNDLNSIENVKNIPTIDKETIIANYDKLIVRDYPLKDKFYVTTGGTSGSPLKFIQSKNVWKKELAFIMDLFEKYGYSIHNKKASFRGGEFSNLKKDIFWKTNPINNELCFSPFHINRDTIKFYIEKMNKEKLLFIHSYPSAILSLLENMQMQNIRLSYKPNAIFLISENYTEEQIKNIGNFFGCKCMSFYGHSERLIFAPSTSDSLDSFKIDDRYGLMELINNNEIVTENGIEGELVGTSFDNYAMPLIRYRTNDITQYVDYNKNIISKIQGRWNQEYLIGKNQEKITLSALNMHSDIFKNIQVYQFMQTKEGNVDFIYVSKKEFTSKDKNIIMKGLNNKTGNLIQFNLTERKAPILTHRGKFSLIIKESNVKL